MNKTLPLICLILALASLISGFTLLSVGEPEADIELHQARISGESDLGELMETQLRKRQWWHNVLVGGLFGATVLFFAAAFWTMGGEGKPR